MVDLTVAESNRQMPRPPHCTALPGIAAVALTGTLLAFVLYGIGAGFLELGDGLAITAFASVHPSASAPPILLAPPSAMSPTSIESTFWPNDTRPLWESIEWPERPPLPAVALARSFSPPASLAAWCPWAEAAAALDANESLSLVVIGGSVTLGSCCGVEARCRWSRHVADWLARVRPGWRLSVRFPLPPSHHPSPILTLTSHRQVRNLAAGAMGAHEWANAPIAGPVDILLVGGRWGGGDEGGEAPIPEAYAQGSGRHVRDRLLLRQPLHLPIAESQVDTSVNGFFYGNASLRANMDRLLWRVTRMRSRALGGGPPAVLYVQVSLRRGGWGDRHDFQAPSP